MPIIVGRIVPFFSEPQEVLRPSGSLSREATLPSVGVHITTLKKCHFPEAINKNSYSNGSVKSVTTVTMRCQSKHFYEMYRASSLTPEERCRSSWRPQSVKRARRVFTRYDQLFAKKSIAGVSRYSFLAGLAYLRLFFRMTRVKICQ